MCRYHATRHADELAAYVLTEPATLFTYLSEQQAMRVAVGPTASALQLTPALDKIRAEAGLEGVLIDGELIEQPIAVGLGLCCAIVGPSLLGGRGLDGGGCYGERRIRGCALLRATAKKVVFLELVDR